MLQTNALSSIRNTVLLKNLDSRHVFSAAPVCVGAATVLGEKHISDQEMWALLKRTGECFQE